ncbi:MAG: NADPH-dependent glutamate synthase [Actinobacteria bacterium]|nr:NADPH-dependent glutamate synthase [Actinomycetota bacterium]
MNNENKKIRIPRAKMPEQPAGDRIKNFKEVEMGLSEQQAVEESFRCLQCKKPICIDGCPVEIDIKSFIKLIGEKEYQKALDKIREKNALPAICGRVCPQEDQCEKKCVLGIKNDPVAIGKLERFVSDFGEKEKKDKNKLEKSTHTSGGNVIKTAVIGSGPAGLTCAGELAKLGYEVTIFEALHKAGGVLIYGIPEFRLPKSVVEREIEYVKSMGVEIILDSVIGKTLTVDELMDKLGCKSVFVATGAGLPYFMDIPGENLNGVYSANEYLTRSNLMKAYIFPNWDTPIKKAREVAVIGGGNVALDSARTAKRLGAENVYLIYRRGEAEMPARIEEIHHAKAEGIEMIFLTNPVEIIGENGWVKKIRCIKMELGEIDSSGRRRPVPLKGSEHDIEVEVVVMAIGQGPNPLLTSSIPGLKLNKKGNIEADEAGRTNKKGVFAGGDIVSGAATVILAMGAGRVAAHHMDEYIKTGSWF